MINFYEKGIDVIKKASEGATKGFICTPYYSERGLSLLDTFFGSAEEVDFWTRFSPLDWRAGVADMAALKKRVQLLLNRKKKFNLMVSDDLHAKIYRFSDNRVIIGSANLTWPAMTSNIEIVCEFVGEEASKIFEILSIFKKRFIPVEAEVFIAYVDLVSDAISKSFDGPIEEDEEMNAAIELAEEELKNILNKTSPVAPRIRHIDIERFINYCKRENTVISNEVIERNDGKHNLQGHVKHCYYGSLRFLFEFPQFIEEIASTPTGSLYSFKNLTIRTGWRDFLRSHAKEVDRDHDFRFHTLRVYIPENLGGICSGGGGGSGTLKRVLPLVARMLQISEGVK